MFPKSEWIWYRDQKKNLKETTEKKQNKKKLLFVSIKLKSDQPDFDFYNESVDDFDALYFWKGNTRRTLWWPVIQEE